MIYLALAGQEMSDPKSKDDIPHFIEAYNLDMSIVKKPLHEFKSMNDFFIRELKPGARPIAGLRRGRDGGEDRSVVVSAADCRLMCFPSWDDATRCATHLVRPPQDIIVSSTGNGGQK